MERDDKDRMIERYHRGARRLEQRKENEAKRKARGGAPRRQRRDEEWGEDPHDGFDAWDEDVEDLAERRPRGRSGPVARSGRAAPAGSAERASAPSDVRHALIAEVARTEVRVLVDGEVRAAQVVPRVRAAGALVVGDAVTLDAAGRVVDRGDRSTALERRDPARPERTRVLAANVDVGVVVLAPRATGLALGFLDRALVAFRGGGIEPVIVVTKADLLSVAERAAIETELEPWRAGGVDAFVVASPTGEGVEALRECLAGQVAVFFGQSGVGKSTLVNALDPRAAQATGAVRASDGRGRHTTTASRLVPFGDGGALVDTPGIRQLVPDVQDPGALIAAFPRLVELALECRFRDCAHLGDAGCALERAAGADAGIAAELARYRRLASPDG